MSVINWDTSPSWATEYGVVGNARHPVWANGNVFQYLSTGVMAKFGADYYSDFYDPNGEIYEMVEVNPLYAGTAKVTSVNLNGAIKSDGGSSSYYDIPLSNTLLEKILHRDAEGSAYIKTEEIIEILGSDFDIGNILKCAVRVSSLLDGKGKEGNSVDYDANKIIYSANRLKERYENSNSR